MASDQARTWMEYSDHAIVHGDITQSDQEQRGARRGERTEAVTTTSGEVAKADWRKLFSASADQTLQFFSPQICNGVVTVKPPGEVFAEGIQHWKNSVVAQFIGRIPNFSQFQRMVTLLWGKDSTVEIKPAGLNLFVIQFSNSEARDRVLEAGPWHIHNKPLIVRKWEPGMKTLDFSMEKLPIWIHLGRVPLELYTRTGLSYIASALGTPLYMDRITSSQQRLAYAKVCIEVAATTIIPSTIDVVLENGSITSITVEAPWLPHRCSNCKIFGHLDKACPSKPVNVVAKVWRPKEKKQGQEECIAEEIIEENGKRAECDAGTSLVSPKNQNMMSSFINKEVMMPNQKTNIETRKASSLNRFAILEEVVEEEDREEIEPEIRNDTRAVTEDENRTEHSPRKPRAASAGVADLMKNLKTKRRGPIDKGKRTSAKVNPTTSGSSLPNQS